MDDAIHHRGQDAWVDFILSMEHRTVAFEMDDFMHEAIASLPRSERARAVTGPTFSDFLPHGATGDTKDADLDALSRSSDGSRSQRSLDAQLRALRSDAVDDDDSIEESVASSRNSAPAQRPPPNGPVTLVPHIVRVLGDAVADAMRRRAGLLTLARDMEMYGRGVFDKESIRRVLSEADHALDDLDATLQRNRVNNAAFVQAVMLYASAIARREVLRDASERGLLIPGSQMQTFFIAQQTETESRLRAVCERM